MRYIIFEKLLMYGMTIKTVDGITVYGANTRVHEMNVPAVPSGGEQSVSFEFRCHLLPGEYFISLGVAVDDDTVDNLAVDRRYDLIHLSVEGGPADFGIADLRAAIRVES